LIDGLERADWVIASRAGTKTPAPLPRRLGNLGLSWWVRALIGHRFGDLTSGFQAFGPRALAVFATRRPDGCADANLRVLGARSGLKILEIPVAMCDRIGGESMHQGLTGVRNYARSLRTSLALARRPD
jgi:hypothetical protein